MINKYNSLVFCSILVTVFSFAPQSMSQTETSAKNGFAEVQREYTKCSMNWASDEYTSAAIFVKRISDKAIEVYFAMGTTRKFQGVNATRDLEVFIQPLKSVDFKNGRHTLFEVGQSASVMTTGWSENKSE